MADISELLKLIQQRAFLEAGGGRSSPAAALGEIFGNIGTGLTSYREGQNKALAAEKAAMDMAPIGSFFNVPSADQEDAMKNLFGQKEQDRVAEVKRRLGEIGSSQQSMVKGGEEFDSLATEAEPKPFESKRAAFESSVGISPDVPASMAKELAQVKALGGSLPIYMGPDGTTSFTPLPGYVPLAKVSPTKAAEMAVGKEKAQIAAGGAEKRQEKSFKQQETLQKKGQDFQSGVTFTKSLQDDYVKASGEFPNVVDSYNRIIQSMKDPSPAGDLALLYNYMKMLDPRSVVRETEFATAAQTGSLPQQIQAAAAKVVKGERLTPEQRRDFFNRSKSLYKGAEQQQSSTEKQFTDRAKKLKIDPSQIVLDYRSKLQKAYQHPLQIKEAIAKGEITKEEGAQILQDDFGYGQ